MRPRVAIIGGGISGLSAAHELRQRAPAVDVLLLEAGYRLGGVIETAHHEGFLIEAAADGFLTTPPTAVELAERVGLGNQMIGTDPARRQSFVVQNGHLQAIPAGFQVLAPSQMRSLALSPVFSMWGKLRVGLEYFVPRKRNDDDESLATFIRRRFGREMFDRLVQPLVGGIYAANPERLSIEATMPRFREMERKYRSLIRAMLHERRKQPNDTDGGARYGRFAAPRKGMSSLITALAERLPPDSVQLSSPVTRILPLDDGRWVLSVGGDCPSSLETDAVILATPAHQAATLLSHVDSAIAGELAQIEYASCAVISLGYRRNQIKHPLNGFGFVVPLAEQRNIFSCSFSSVKYAGRAPTGSVLLRTFIGGACQHGLLRLSDEELIQLARLEVAELLGTRGMPVLHHITRHCRVMAQYHVGHPNRMARIHSRLGRFPTLAMAGSAYGGVGVPACIRSGQAAANQVLSRLNSTMSSSRMSCVEAETIA